jgi:hypothetical protein
MKISNFVFIINLHFFFAIIFFSDNNFSYAYKHNGKYNFIGNLFKTFFSVIFIGIIKSWLNRLSLSQRLIQNIKFQKLLEEKIKKLINKLILKVTFYFISLFLCLFFFWYYFTIFFSIYINSQIIVLESTSFIFIIYMGYPFIICFFTCLTRKIAIKKRSRFLYKISQLLDYL